MKPKTKLQKKVHSLHIQLPLITDKQEKYAFNNCFTLRGMVMRKTIFCLECGHDWKDNNLVDNWNNWNVKYEKAKHEERSKIKRFKSTCPNCNKRIEFTNSYDNGLHKETYYQVITTIEDFQVFRFYLVSKRMKKKQKPFFYCNEIVQHWIGANGSYTPMACMGQGSYGYYAHTWCRGEITIKDTKLSDYKYALTPSKTYPRKRYLPTLKRSGYDGHTYGLLEYQFIGSWLTTPILETLIKTNKHSFISAFIEHNQKFINYWPSLKICWRNHYDIKDIGIWIDYMQLLEYFNRDIRSPKYICPADLKKEHDRYVEKNRTFQRKRKAEETRLRMQEDQINYHIDKSKFFNLKFYEGNISIEPMKSVNQVMQESDYLNHCAFTNQYHNKKNSLLLSARIDDIVIETIEVNLLQMTIIQSRGRKNNPSKYNKQIIDLMTKNMIQIKNCLVKKKNKKKELA